MQQINQPSVSNLSARRETVQDKHRNAFDVGILYPSFTISNLENSGENGDGDAHRATNNHPDLGI